MSNQYSFVSGCHMPDMLLSALPCFGRIKGRQSPRATRRRDANPAWHKLHLQPHTSSAPIVLQTKRQHANGRWQHAAGRRLVRSHLNIHVKSLTNQRIVNTTSRVLGVPSTANVYTAQGSRPAIFAPVRRHVLCAAGAAEKGRQAEGRRDVGRLRGTMPSEKQRHPLTVSQAGRREGFICRARARRAAGTAVLGRGHRLHGAGR